MTNQDCTTNEPSQQTVQEQIQTFQGRLELQEKWVKFLEEQVILAQANLEQMKHRLQQLRNQEQEND